MFTRKDAQDLRNDGEKILDDWFRKEFGWRVKLGNIRYGHEMTVKITLSKAGNRAQEEKADELKAEREWDLYAVRKGCEKDWYGLEYLSGQTGKVTIIGIRPKAKKNCVVIVDSQGKTWVTSPFAVRMHLDAAKARKGKGK